MFVCCVCSGRTIFFSSRVFGCSFCQARAFQKGFLMPCFLTRCECVRGYSSSWDTEARGNTAPQTHHACRGWTGFLCGRERQSGIDHRRGHRGDTNRRSTPARHIDNNTRNTAPTAASTFPSEHHHLHRRHYHRQHPVAVLLRWSWACLLSWQLRRCCAPSLPVGDSNNNRLPAVAKQAPRRRQGASRSCRFWRAWMAEGRGRRTRRIGYACGRPPPCTRRCTCREMGWSTVP